MNYLEALNKIADDPGIKRLRELCDDANPDTVQRDKYRGQAIRLAQGGNAGIVRKAINAARAAGRVAQAVARQEPVRVTTDQHEARKAICEPCDQLVDGNCRLCGCSYRAKVLIATEECPIGKWPKINEAASPA